MAAPATPGAFYKMVSVSDAQETVLRETKTLPSIDINLVDAVGHTLAEDVVAADPLPPFRASIKVGRSWNRRHVLACEPRSVDHSPKQLSISQADSRLLAANMSTSKCWKSTGTDRGSAYPDSKK